MIKLLKLFLLVLEIFFFTSCSNQVKSDFTCEKDSLCLEGVSAQDGYQYLNVFFQVDPIDLLEMDGESCKGELLEDGSVSKKIQLGKKLGEANFIIKLPKVYIEHGGTKYELLNDSDMTVCSMKAWDLDGDGEKEILVHTGDLFDLYIFQIQAGKPELCGRVGSNMGFFVKENHDIISRIGSQGVATLLRLVDGKLKILEEDYYYPYNE